METEGSPTSSHNGLLIFDDNDVIRAYVRPVFAADYPIVKAADLLATGEATVPPVA
ncbi:hypothetical protein [Fibrisoma montanum]|uniref:hypothetical protein n=1 Tax=Fibrisoma montanum TaxID=2305895 RepID=UPI0013145130|nr:hypothetical protein [Fibrisoma montanum]